MEIRGERECRSCGARWSYYDTGSVACPDCGSVHSVGVDDRTRHTATGPDLDLSDARSAAADRPLREACEDVAGAAGDYVRQRGFIDAGDLRDLDGTFVAAHELRAAAGQFSRAMAPDDEAERYLLALLRGAEDGDRPPAAEVPASMRAARGLAAARAVDAYLGELSTWLGERGDATEGDGGDREPPGLRGAMERLRDHVRRVEALDGDVPPADADRLVAAARELAAYARTGDPADLETARSRLDALA